MFILCTLCIRIRNWCIRWACTQGTYAYADHPPKELMHALSIHVISSCVHWACASGGLPPAELFCILLIYAAPYWAAGRSTEFHCTLLSYVHPTELHCTLYNATYTVKKGTKLSLGGNNEVITELFLPRGSLVSDIPAGDGKLVNLFLRCTELCCTRLNDAAPFEKCYILLSHRALLLSYAAPNWVTLHPLNWTVPYWATAHCWTTRHTLWVSAP